jgi:hypothetical protein
LKPLRPHYCFEIPTAPGWGEDLKTIKLKILFHFTAIKKLRQTESSPLKLWVIHTPYRLLVNTDFEVAVLDTS